jgi:hypothetical protein
MRPQTITFGFVCSACGRRCAEVRPDFNWNAADWVLF